MTADILEDGSGRFLQNISTLTTTSYSAITQGTEF